MSDQRRWRLTIIGTDEDRVIDRDGTATPNDAEGGSGRDVRPLPAEPEDLAAGRRRYEVTVDGWVVTVAAEPADRAILRERALRAGGGAGHGGPQSIKARIPGRVARVWVSVGDEVAAGDRVLSVEAMKMENEIRSPVAGVVRSIDVAVDDRVELGAVLAVVG